LLILFLLLENLRRFLAIAFLRSLSPDLVGTLWWNTNAK